MGVFDKLKNVFFEEEYVEVEEPVKKPKKEKPAVAKKIDLPEMPKLKEEKSPREKRIEEEVVERVEKKEFSERESKKNEGTFKFPMSFEDEDFKVENLENSKQKELKRDSLYKSSAKSFETKKGYSAPLVEEEYKHDYGSGSLYEGGEVKKESKAFRPTPIISPIYGILDKNYTKDEIVSKKEVRLTSASSKKMDLDSIREKAYGDLASDITASMMEEEDDEDHKDAEEDSVLYDLNDSDSPVVNKVTVGDAEEYYQDLGLEYNIDYKDHAKEKASGRRSGKKGEEKVELPVEDSLFDLIDSMYQDSEEDS